MVRLRAITITICAVILVAIIPLAGSSASATAPWQCSDPTANLYDYPASVAQACGFATVPLERTSSAPDGGADYIYSIDGQEVDLAQPPVNFDPLTASDAQLSYYGFPPRPSDPASYASWASEVGDLHVIPPTQFLILMPGVDSEPDICKYGNNQAEACWGGYVNTASDNKYTASYIDYIEPAQEQTSCPDDAVLTWTGLGGYNNNYLAQAGTAPFYEGKEHTTWWEFWPDHKDVVPWRLVVSDGDDIQVHVNWVPASNAFTMQVTDTTTHQMTQLARYPLSPTDQPDLTTADYIVERPTTKDNDFLHQLRNFFTWNVKSAQAAAYGGSLEGLQNYPWTRLNIYDKSSNDQLEATYPLDSDGFSATWEDCD